MSSCWRANPTNASSDDISSLSKSLALPPAPEKIPNMRGSPNLKTSGIVGSEFPAPLSDGFVRNNDSAFGQKIFHITEAQTEAMIDPYGIADDFRREAVSAVTGSGAVHEMSLSVGCPS
jgi:hypothetical protein